MREIVEGVLIVCLCLTLTGCAVGMALSGKAEPEMDDLEIGMPIDQAHFIMRNYTPQVNTLSNGDRQECYVVQIGNAPSAGRAIGHLAMDVLTWGAWEIIGTPVEGLSSKKAYITITYSTNETGKYVVSNIKAGKEEGGI